MKKLMIAAALAAMIGGVQADVEPLALGYYDFTASLKTTAGKLGKATKGKTHTYTVNLGKTEDGTYWWEDAGYNTADEGKAAVKKMGDDEKRAFALDELGFDVAAYDAAKPADAKKSGEFTEYSEKILYKNKKQWCTTFTFTMKDDDIPGVCYRVAGSRKLKFVIEAADCCGDAWSFGEFDDDKTFVGYGPVMNLMVYRFGGQTLSAAKKVEYIGQIGALENVTNDGYTDDGELDYAEQPNLVFAGQGTWANLGKDGDTTYAGIQSISGNIVGSLPGPLCENCCDDSDLAVVFDCTAEAEDEYVDVADRGTAAYGTWSIKFNKKASGLK